MSFFAELRRRNVFRVGAAYVLLGWVVVQVTDTVSPALNLPEWTLSFVTWIGIIGFPFALFFAWAFELTPDGIKRELDVDRAESITGATGRKLDIVLIGLLVVTIGFIFWDRDSSAPERVAQAEDAPSDSIAVLPLINMSAAADNAFFAGGVHEELLTNLSRIRDLRVVSRTTALRYVDSDLSLRDIGRELGVRYIVEGSVRRIENHVRITVQLIDAVDDAHVWANNYDRELVDVFATQSEVAKQITDSLHLEIKPETVGTLNDMPTHSVKAYDQYLQAKNIARSEYESEDGLMRQRALLESAVAADPDFVEAWAYLNEVLDFAARTVIQNQWFGETEEEREASFAEIRQTAARALEKAIALDPDSVETVLAQASDFVAEQQDPEFRTARKQFIDRAIDLEPDNAFVWYVLAWWFRIEGNDAMATTYFLKALELDPFHAAIVTGSLLHFRSIGDEEMTARLFERLGRIVPEKSDDRTLAEISSYARIDNLVTQFISTADESILERVAEELAESAGTFDSDVEETTARLRFREFQGDLDGMLAVSTGEFPETGEFYDLLLYFFANEGLLSAQRLAGRFADAEATALHILDARSQVRPPPGLGDATFFDRFNVLAYATLDNDERAREFAEALLDDDGFPFDKYQSAPFVILSHVDPERAVQLTLANRALHPAWHGPDIMAAAHVWARNIIVHPDMQRYYVEEGKWVDYLAERVPEYAQYTQ
ncbi:MAG TPA: hypothetical protein VLA11_09930 [Woeseiaceae bacterium]|jgi:TolB-like protein|nr:hypothetical protein [Woeseiaceae bacterium]